jgi:hypothetical protein
MLFRELTTAQQAASFLSEEALNRHLKDQGLPPVAIMRAPTLVDRATGTPMMIEEPAPGGLPAWVIAISVVLPLLSLIAVAGGAYHLGCGQRLREHTVQEATDVVPLDSDHHISSKPDAGAAEMLSHAGRPAWFTPEKERRVQVTETFANV